MKDGDRRSLPPAEVCRVRLGATCATRPRPPQDSRGHGTCPSPSHSRLGAARGSVTRGLGVGTRDTD